MFFEGDKVKNKFYGDRIFTVCGPPRCAKVHGNTMEIIPCKDYADHIFDFDQAHLALCTFDADLELTNPDWDDGWEDLEKDLDDLVKSLDNDVADTTKPHVCQAGQYPMHNPEDDSNFWLICKVCGKWLRKADA